MPETSIVPLPRIIASHPRSALLCPPIYYDVEYAINGQMAQTLQHISTQKVDKERAMLQWSRLVGLLDAYGVKMYFMKPREGLPDMPFTANAGLLFRGTMALSNFKPKERRGEIPHLASFFLEKLTASVVLVPFSRDGNPAPLFFEGQGEALYYRDRLFCGYGIRSTREGAHAALAALHFHREHAFLLLTGGPKKEWFYHLDTCFCPMGEDLLWYPPAFSAGAQTAIHSFAKGEHSIEIDEADAMRFVANGVYLGGANGRVLITSPMSPALKERLTARGITVRENDVSEFLKAGGGNKCLTFLFN